MSGGNGSSEQTQAQENKGVRSGAVWREGMRRVMMVGELGEKQTRHGRRWVSRWRLEWSGGGRHGHPGR